MITILVISPSLATAAAFQRVIRSVDSIQLRYLIYPDNRVPIPVTITALKRHLMGLESYFAHLCEENNSIMITIKAFVPQGSQNTFFWGIWIHQSANDVSKWILYQQQLFGIELLPLSPYAPMQYEGRILTAEVSNGPLSTLEYLLGLHFPQLIH